MTDELSSILKWAIFHANHFCDILKNIIRRIFDSFWRCRKVKLSVFKYWYILFWVQIKNNLRKQWKKAQIGYEAEIKQYQSQLDIFFAAETELGNEYNLCSFQSFFFRYVETFPQQKTLSVAGCSLLCRKLACQVNSLSRIFFKWYMFEMQKILL